MILEKATGRTNQGGRQHEKIAHAFANDGLVFVLWPVDKEL